MDEKKPVRLVVPEECRTSKGWTVKEALEEAIKKIEDGEINANSAVLILIQDEEGHERPLVRYVNQTKSSAVYYLSQVLHQELHRLG